MGSEWFGFRLGGFDGGDDFFGGVVEVHCADDGESAFSERLFACFHVIAFESDDEGQFEARFASGFDDSGGDDVAVHDAAEDVDEDALDFRIGEDDLESGGHLVFGGTATDVEEVRGFTSGELDDVHGGHGESCSVDEASDVSVEADVVEVELTCFDFAGILLGFVAHGDDVGLAEQGVVVEVELGVEGEEALVWGDHEWVDLDERAIGFDEQLEEVGEELGGLVHQGATQAEGGCDAAGLVCLQADGGVDGDAEDLFWGFFGDGFDVHPAFGAGDDHGGGGGAVEQDGEVEFALDINGFGDEQFADQLAFGAGLVSDQRLADHLAGGRGCFFGVVAEVHAAFEPVLECPFSAATGMDLGFDDDVPDTGGCEFLRDFSCFLGAVSDFAAGGGDAVFLEEFSGLVFVDVHVEWCERM